MCHKCILIAGRRGPSKSFVKCAATPGTTQTPTSATRIVSERSPPSCVDHESLIIGIHSYVSFASGKYCMRSYGAVLTTSTRRGTHLAR